MRAMNGKAQDDRLRLETQVWVSRMIEDPTRHEQGLRAWVGEDPLRADAYNAAYRATAIAGDMGRQIYGTARQRQAARTMEKIRDIPYRRLLGITVALSVAGATFGLGIGLATGKFSFHHHAMAAPTQFATRIGELRDVQLADGSRVHLDTNSEIRADFSANERNVALLRGRARFTVAHDTSWPFVVEALGGSVTARGTVFDVDLGQDVKVHLISGAVDVRVPGAAGPNGTNPIVHLRTGQQVRFSPGSAGPAPVAMAAPPQDTQWVTTQRTFDDVPARDIVSETNRYSQTKIRFANPADGDPKVFTDLDMRDPNEVAKSLALLEGLGIDTSQPGAIILRRKQ